MVDWHVVFADIQQCEITMRDTAGAPSRYWCLYSAWRGDTLEKVRPGTTAGDLRHADGVKVLRLWAEVTHREEGDAPKLG